MKNRRMLGILPILALVVAAGCNDTPTRTTPAGPSFENGGSYGSGGRTAADSTGSAAGLQQSEANGGSYGSGG